MEELFSALYGADLNDPATVNRINSIIADINRLGAEVMSTADAFLAGNPEVVVTDFSPPILTFGDSASDMLKRLIAQAGGSYYGSSSTTTVTSYAGQYAQGDSCINLYPDGTYMTLSANGGTTAGRYSVSGNVITFVGSDGGTGTGTITSIPSPTPTAHSSNSSETLDDQILPEGIPFRVERLEAWSSGRAPTRPPRPRRSSSRSRRCSSGKR